MVHTGPGIANSFFHQLQFDAVEAEYLKVKSEAERVIALYSDSVATADAYDKARPACPPQILEIARVYRGFPPRTVADVGCGTGLSTLAWAEAAREVASDECPH